LILICWVKRLFWKCIIYHISWNFVFCTFFAKWLDFAINIWIFSNFFFLSDYWRSAPFKKCIKCIKFVWQEGYRGGVIPPPQSILCKPDLSRSIGYTFLLWPLEKNMKGLNWVMTSHFYILVKENTFSNVVWWKLMLFYSSNIPIKIFVNSKTAQANISLGFRIILYIFVHWICSVGDTI